jgi:hypothetical protein
MRFNLKEYPMSSKIKILSLLLVVVAVAALGASAIFAQDSTDPTLPPCPMWAAGGQGMMMGMGTHRMWDSDTAPMFTAVAEALGIDTETLTSELQSGKSIADLAAEYGIDLATITASAQAGMEAHLSDLVAAGVLTQAQADAHLSQMQEHWAQMPMFSGSGFGMMLGGHGGHHGRFNDGAGRGMRRGG